MHPKQKEELCTYYKSRGISGREKKVETTSWNADYLQFGKVPILKAKVQHGTLFNHH